MLYIFIARGVQPSLPFARRLSLYDSIVVVYLNTWYTLGSNPDRAKFSRGWCGSTFSSGNRHTSYARLEQGIFDIGVMRYTVLAAHYRKTATQMARIQTYPRRTACSERLPRHLFTSPSMVSSMYLRLVTLTSARKTHATSAFAFVLLCDFRIVS